MSDDFKAGHVAKPSQSNTSGYHFDWRINKNSNGDSKSSHQMELLITLKQIGQPEFLNQSLQSVFFVMILGLKILASSTASISAKFCYSDTDK